MAQWQKEAKGYQLVSTMLSKSVWPQKPQKWTKAQETNSCMIQSKSVNSLCCVPTMLCFVSIHCKRTATSCPVPWCFRNISVLANVHLGETCFLCIWMSHEKLIEQHWFRFKFETCTNVHTKCSSMMSVHSNLHPQWLCKGKCKCSHSCSTLTHANLWPHAHGTHSPHHCNGHFWGTSF